MKAVIVFLFLSLYGVSISDGVAVSRESSKSLIVPIKAKDFHDCSYVDIFNCALARATKRFCKTDDVFCGPDNITIDGIFYRIKNGYHADKYDGDEFYSMFLGGDKIIRCVKLIKR